MGVVIICKLITKEKYLSFGGSGRFLLDNAVKPFNERRCDRRKGAFRGNTQDFFYEQATCGLTQEKITDCGHPCCQCIDFSDIPENTASERDSVSLMVLMEELCF
jgi:hypothetical protein